MGYYAHIRDHDLCIRDTKRAIHLLRDAGFNGDDFIEALMIWGYEEVELDEHGNVTCLIFNNKYGAEDRLWRALAPVIEPTGDDPPFIEWQGEENEVWRYVFEDGEVTEVGCEVLWPYLNQTVKATAVVDPLTLGEESTGLLATAIEAHIDYLETLQRNGRDWYEDRYRQPGSTRPPYPDNIDVLIREAKMTLKSIKDAERVVLNPEVIQ